MFRSAFCYTLLYLYGQVAISRVFSLPPCVLERYISNPDVEHHNSYATFLIDEQPVDCFTVYVTDPEECMADNLNEIQNIF